MFMALYQQGLFVLQCPTLIQYHLLLVNSYRQSEIKYVNKLYLGIHQMV